MFGNDPKKIEKMMKRLNLNVRQVDADKVVIEGKEKKIVIRNPEIMIADMMGREVYQITGNVEESMPVREEDILMVMEKTGKDRKTVVEKLEELDNDLARAIIELKEK
ncbi:MAG: nascent polypeptide-associated complex protein [Candidatus Aenigmarchaeota archaeon]|nr:nascent polypeptide-associated complex protein [Candidatus Aenigmarchaeota archaeon]MDI6722464.1 nascent polypeptide-associated complex protein [Candidatus Aenigmarchaeota archaeon]